MPHWKRLNCVINDTKLIDNPNEPGQRTKTKNSTKFCQNKIFVSKSYKPFALNINSNSVISLQYKMMGSVIKENEL